MTPDACFHFTCMHIARSPPPGSLFRRFKPCTVVQAPKPKKVKKSKDATPAAPASVDSGASDQSAVPPVETAEPMEAEEPEKPADPLALDNFALSAGVKALLRKKGIESLFPIQVRHKSQDGLAP